MLGSLWYFLVQAFLFSLGGSRAQVNKASPRVLLILRAISPLENTQLLTPVAN